MRSNIKGNRIRAALAYAKVTQAEVAEKIGWTKSNFNQKLIRETFTNEEMEQIMKAIGAKYVPATIVFPDGTTI